MLWQDGLGNMEVEVGQVVSQIIAFLILLAVLKRFAWGPLLQLLEEREERIRSEFDTIAKHKEDAEVDRKSVV